MESVELAQSPQVVRIHTAAEAERETSSKNGKHQNGHHAETNGHSAEGHFVVEGAKDGAKAGVESAKTRRLVSQASSMDRDAMSLKIVYKDLSWTVDVPNPDTTNKQQKTIKKSILKSVSGSFRPGKFTAILGSSGAGKTSLLNVIAGYGTGGKTEGQILVNGHQVSNGMMRELSGFVHQHDIILPSMTVREAVRMAAYLRLPKSLPNSEKDSRVEEVLRWLNLVKVADNQIGSPDKKGISGGERRRVSVAMELVRNPGILYLDEPTSGLDSFTAYAVAHLLKNVAHQHNRTIVATIHQPSSEIFHLFDDLILINFGKIIYHGPAQEAMEYFSANLGYQIPRYTNPSDYIFMHILNSDASRAKIGTLKSKAAAQKQLMDVEAGLEPGSNGKEEAKTPETLADPHESDALTAEGSVSPSNALSLVDREKAREQRIIDMWNLPNGKNGRYTSHYTRLMADVEAQSLATSALPDEKTLANNVASFTTQWYFLCMRAFNDMVRNPYKLRARLGQALFIGLFAALCYLDAGHGQDGVQNRRGVLFFLCASGIMNSTMGTLPMFAGEKEVFIREYGARMYGIAPFFFSKFMMELPLRIIMPLFTTLIMYWAVGLQSTAEHFFIFTGTISLLEVVGTSLGMFFATIFPSLPVALAASPMVLLPLMLFSGFFLNSNSIPPYFDWLQYISPIKWGFLALARNEFPGLEFNCDKPNAYGICPYKTGEDVLAQLNFDNQPSMKEAEGILLVLAAGLFSLAYLALWRTSRKL